MKKEISGIICAMALVVCPFEAMAGSGTIEEGWDLFNKARYTESLALSENLIREYPADTQKTPEILLLVSLNYDHIASKSGKAEDELKAKAAAETVTIKYPESRQAAEAYFYLGEVYSGHVPVKIETDCAKALPMYIKAIQKADKQWVKDGSVKGIERCKMRPPNDTEQEPAGVKVSQPALPAPSDGSGRSRKVSVKVEKAPLVRVLDAVSEQARVNFLVLADVEALKVSMDANKVPLPDFLSMLERAAGLHCSGLADSDIYVLSKEVVTFAQLPADPRLDAPVRLRFKAAPLKIVLEAITSQSEAKFMYGEAVGNEKTTIFVNNAKARDALSLLLAMKVLRIQEQEGKYLIEKAVAAKR